MSRVSPISQSVRSAGVSNVGRIRMENQDAILIDDKLPLWLVADGMGGHAGGARASAIARDTLFEQLSEGHELNDAIMAAHYAICAVQRDDDSLSDMGTTVVAASESDEHYEICWVGDSRAYKFVPETGSLQLLTRDHNVAGMLVASGALSPSEAARHPQRHVLTDCLGLAGEEEPRIGSLNGKWQPGEILMLCSDGLTGELLDDEIELVFRESSDLEAIVAQLLERALEAGAHDNVSLVLVQAPPIEGEAGKRWRWPFGRRGS